MLAAMNGHKDTILMLIKKGANLNLVNKVSMYLFVKVKFYYYSFLKCINITWHTIVMKAEVIFNLIKIVNVRI